MKCIFCEIISGASPAHIAWEDDEHLAILSIFPNTSGVTVVFPKTHHPSYAFALEDQTLTRLVLAVKKVGLLLDQAFDDVGRTAMALEGFGVNHVHAKLFPLHGTPKVDSWVPIKSNVNRYFDQYEGFISTHDHLRADDTELAALASRIRAIEGGQ